MIRDITLGQYYPGNSWVHRLDPRVKILAAILYIVLLFVVKNVIGFVLMFVALETVIILSKVPRKFIWKGLKPIILILAFTLIFNLFMVPGTILVKFGIFKITQEGLRTALLMGARLVMLIIGTSMLTLTTKPMSLTDGIEALLSPLKKVGLPAQDIAMMMTIALRFIPTLLEETDKIIKAQQARGADFETGNLINRAKALIPILVPLFISAFRIAQDLAMAMESRCYGGPNRTRMNRMKLGKNDAVAVAFLIVLTALAILDRVILQG